MVARLAEIARNIKKLGFCVLENKHPKRKIVFQRFERPQDCVLGDSIVYGVCLNQAITISCPGGQIATLNHPSIIEELIKRNIRRVAVIAGTNNLCDKQNKKLMHPLETTDEMQHLVANLRSIGLRVCVVSITSRKRRYRLIRQTNRYYRFMAAEMGVSFYRLKKFRYRKHISWDGLHPNPKHVRELARDLRAALNMLR